MSDRNASQQHDQFNAVWGNPRGWRALTIVNHTTIGLRRREGKIDEIAERVGYGSASAFSTAFSRYVGVPPKRYALAASAA